MEDTKLTTLGSQAEPGGLSSSSSRFLGRRSGQERTSSSYSQSVTRAPSLLPGERGCQGAAAQIGTPCSDCDQGGLHRKPHVTSPSDHVGSSLYKFCGLSQSWVTPQTPWSLLFTEFSPTGHDCGCTQVGWRAHKRAMHQTALPPSLL